MDVKIKYKWITTNTHTHIGAWFLKVPKVKFQYLSRTSRFFFPCSLYSLSVPNRIRINHPGSTGFLFLQTKNNSNLESSVNISSLPIRKVFPIFRVFLGEFNVTIRNQRVIPRQHRITHFCSNSNLTNKCKYSWFHDRTN